MISLWGWGPPWGPQWWFWERYWGCFCSGGWFSSRCTIIPQNFAFPAHSAGLREREGLPGLPAEPPTRGLPHWACSGMSLEPQHNFSPVLRVGLMQKPGFLQAVALTQLQELEFGDKDQRAEVPLTGLSRERRLLARPQAKG